MSATENFLSTERLYFSHWVKSDYKNALKLWGNPNVVKLIARITSTNRKVKNLLELEIEHNNKYGIQYWPIYAKSDNEFIGCCGLRINMEKEPMYELGCHICEEFWNKGYAYEASLGVIKYAFGELGIKEIFARHNPSNLASKIVLIKIGFRPIGEGYLKETGLFHPEYLLNINEFNGFLSLQAKII